jgi:hypothetical protein
VTQIPVLPQHYSSQGILSFPSSVAMPTISAGDKSNTSRYYFLFSNYSEIWSLKLTKFKEEKKLNTKSTGLKGLISKTNLFDLYNFRD